MAPLATIHNEKPAAATDRDGLNLVLRTITTPSHGKDDDDDDIQHDRVRVQPRP